MARATWGAAYYQEMHARAVEREARLRREFQEESERHRARLHEALEVTKKLKQEIADLNAMLKLRAKQAFGKKTERRARVGAPGSKVDGRKAGQQEGSPGHGRETYESLPERTEVQALPPDALRCPQCQKERTKKSDAEGGAIIEIEVRAYRRRVNCERAESACECEGPPKVVVAPRPGQLIPRGLLGVSVWVMVLVNKFLHQQPTNRLLELLRLHGIDLSAGTVTEGLARLAPLFAPIVEGLRERLRTASLFHADETGWYVFVTREGKKGHRWYLWFFLSKDVVFVELDPSRSAEVPRKVLGMEVKGFLSVDRYSGYKAFAKLLGGRLLLAFCWAHVRRDFITMAVTQPLLAVFANEWVERISKLYELNGARTAARVAGHDDAREKQRLVAHLESMNTARRDELMTVPDKGAQAKALKSLGRHWDGLTLFVEHPDIPLDNNAAERRVRNPVGGRKNYYGSRAEWSGQLAAAMFSLFPTLELNGINPRLWLTAYLEACAANDGKPPDDAVSYLPWNLSPERRERWALEKTRTERRAMALQSAATEPVATEPVATEPVATEPAATEPAAAQPAPETVAPKAAPAQTESATDSGGSVCERRASCSTSKQAPESDDEILRTRIRRPRSRADPPNHRGRAPQVSGGNLQTDL